MSLRLIVLAVVQGLSSVLGPLIASRQLGAKAIGEIALAFAVVSLLRPSLSMGLGGSVTVLAFRENAGVAHARYIVKLSVIASLVLLALLFVAHISPLAPAQMVTATLGAGIAAALALVLMPFLQAANQQMLYIALIVGSSLAAHLGSLAVVSRGGPNAEGYVGAFAAVTLLVSIGVGSLAVRGRRQKVPLQHALKIGRPLIPTGLATAAMAFADRPLVNAILGPEQLGIYFLVYIMAAGAIPLASSVSNGWLPAVLRTPPAKRSAALTESSRIYIGAFAGLGVGFGLIAPVILSYWVGEAFDSFSVRTLAVVLGLSAAPYTAYLASSVELYERGDTRYIMKATLIGASASIVSTIALGSAFGLVGVGIASLLGYIVLAETARQGMRLAEVAAIILKTMLQSMAIYAVLALPTVSVSSLLGNDVPSLACGVAICAISMSKIVWADKMRSAG